MVTISRNGYHLRKWLPFLKMVTKMVTIFQNDNHLLKKGHHLVKVFFEGGIPLYIIMIPYKP